MPRWLSDLAGTTRDTFGLGPKVSRSTLDASLLTAPRLHQLPDEAGVFALTSQLSAYLPLTGGVLTGKVTSAPSTASQAGFRFTPGVAPSAPQDGDAWVDASGFNVQASGVTIVLPSAVPTQAANLVYAGPGAGGAATPSFRTLVSADIPALDFAKITTGTVPLNRLSPGAGWDHYLSWNSDADTSWKRLATISTGLGLYTGAAYELEVIDSDTDQGLFVSAKVMPFVVRVTRSAAVQDDQDDAAVSGPVADYIRAVKTATGEYQIQCRSPNTYKRITIRARLNHSLGAVSTTWDTLAAAGAGTTYAAVPGHAHLFPWISTQRITNLTANGFVKTINADGTLAVDTATYQPLSSALTDIAGLTAPSAPSPGLRNVIVHNGTNYLWDVVDAQGTAFYEAGVAVSTHEAALDPHPQYLTTASAASSYQPLDADLTAIAGLTAPGSPPAGQVNVLSYSGGAHVWSTALNSSALSGYQPLDADLTAIADLSTTGYARRTGTDTWALSATVPWSDLASIPTPVSTIGNIVPTDGDMLVAAGGGFIRLQTTNFSRNLLNLSDATTWRTNLGAAASGAVTSSGLTVSATDRILGRATAGSGAIEEITCTSFARTILDDADAATVRTTIGAQPLISARDFRYHSGASTAASATTYIFTTADYDNSGGDYNSTTGGWTVPANGLYAVSARIGGNNSSGSYSLQLYKNGAIYIAGNVTPAPSSGPSVSIVVRLTAGDVITVRPNVALSGVASDTSRTYFSASRIS